MKTIYETMKDNEREVIKRYYREIGRKGGEKTADRGPDFFREIQRKSVESRKRNKKKPLQDSEHLATL